MTIINKEPETELAQVLKLYGINIKNRYRMLEIRTPREIISYEN